MTPTFPWRPLAAVGLLVLTAGLPSTAQAGRAEMAGYMRVGTRPDLLGGGNQLGYWNLYGRLLNESPYAALELKYDVLERDPRNQTPYTSLHFRVEGWGVGRAEPSNGSLTNWHVTQMFAKAGNVAIPGVEWQVGTLYEFMGDLGLYDIRPAEVFFETVGLGARTRKGPLSLYLGIGDSGYFLKGNEYNTVPTAGGTARLRVGKHVELGGGGQYRFEPSVAGNRNATHDTPGISYEDFLRGEVVGRYLMENPNREREFPDPVATNAQSWKAIGYLGFGGFGPLRWNNFFVKYEKLHPQLKVTESFEGVDYDIYVNSLTDQRTVLLLGNEAQLTLWPDRLDMAWSVLYGDHTDLDNTLAPSDHNRTYKSTVLRLQAYPTRVLHVLVESSIAQEKSKNGNAYREHADSIFSNTDGLPDTEGFGYGDTDTRNTWQGKGGLVINPKGPGIYTRPSLRMLYGVQYSNQNNAFGNSFVETIDQFNEFGNVERHWHHVASLEMEAWF